MPQFDQKIRSEGYLILSLYINQPIKKFSIVTFLEMIDSSVKNLGDVENDK